MKNLAAKQILISGLLVTFLTGNVPVALAVPNIPASGSAARTTALDQRITKLKAKAGKEIDRRITTLNNLLAKLGVAKKLSDSDKTTLTNSVQADVNNLTSLKAKIDADSDLSTLRIDVQAIVKDYRVYALLVPQVALIVASDRVDTAIETLNTVYAKLNTRIQTDVSQGKDAATLQASLTDMQEKIKDAQKQAQAVHDSILPLTPDGYPGNKTILQTGRADLKLAVTDLKAARDDAKSIIKALKDLEAAPQTP